MSLDAQTALLATQPGSHTISVRLDPELHFTATTDGPAGTAVLDGESLRFSRATIGQGRERVVILEAGSSVERAERLVCRLYGIPPDVEAEIVAHATERARRRTAEE